MTTASASTTVLKFLCMPITLLGSHIRASSLLCLGNPSLCLANVFSNVTTKSRSLMMESPSVALKASTFKKRCEGAVVSRIKCLDVPANGDSCTVGIFLNTILQTIEHARQAYSSKVDGVTNKTFLNPMLNLWNNTGFSLYRRIYPKGKHEWRCVITRFPRPYNMQLQVTWVFQYIVRLTSPFAVSHTAALNGIFDSLVNHICDPQFLQLYFNLGQRVQSQLLILARLDYLVQTVMRVGRRFSG